MTRGTEVFWFFFSKKNFFLKKEAKIFVAFGDDTIRTGVPR
jgi:hypothetical protein